MLHFKTVRIGQGDRKFMKAVRPDSIIEINQTYVNLKAEEPLCEEVVEVIYKGAHGEKSFFIMATDATVEFVAECVEREWV